jgi:pyruvate dehydrogenase E2 component (dihydrolipoamide acetyltransferase)
VPDVTIPALGMAMTEAVLTRWHKQPGDAVATGEVVAEIETDKSNVDLESPAEGVLGPHLVDEGDAVPVGAAVTRVLAVGESEPSPASQPGAGPRDATDDVASPVEPPVAPVPDPVPAAPVAHVPDPVPAAPVVHVPGPVPAAPVAEPPPGPGPLRRYAPPPRPPHRLSPRKRRLERLEAEADTFAAVAAEGGPTQAREAARASGATPPARTSGRYRAAITERVARSWREIPHFAVQREIDAGEADSVLAAVRERDPDATWTDLLLRAFALALSEAPTGGGDVGLAVATPDGILMPVVSAVPGLDVSGLVTRRASAVRRAREGRLSPADLNATPVGSLSNLGARGIDSFTGVIPLQQQLLLTVGRVAARPVVVDGRLAVRTTVVATLNVDHRSLDGDQAARILMAFDRELGALRGWAEGGPR